MEKLLFVWLCVTVTLATFVPPARAFSPAVPVPTFRTCVSPARCAAPVGQVRMGNEIRGSPEKWRKIVAAVRSEAVVPQRVAIVGAGAVGLYYGGRLLEAGHDVSFLARRDLADLQKDGLTIESVDGDCKFASVAAFGSPAELRAASSGDMDWVIVSLKSYSLPAVPDLLTPLVGPSTRILAIMNGLGIEETLAQTFPADKIFGGMAFTCNNRVDGVVKHLRYGALLVGHNGDEATELAEVEKLFEHSNVRLSTAPCLLESRWEKLCWNVPFNGLACAMGGITTDKIVGDADLRALALEMMREVVETGKMDLAANSLEGTGALGQPLIDRMFSLTDSMGPYRPSTMIDLVEGSPMEVEYIFSNPLQRAKELGGPCAHVESVVQMIRAQDRLRGLEGP